MRVTKVDSAPLLRHLIDAHKAADSSTGGFDRDLLAPAHARVRKRQDGRQRQRARAPVPARTDFDAAFVDGQTFLNDDGRPLTVTVREIGSVAVTSGRIVACDPGYGSSGVSPLTRTVPPGRYPVVLSAAEGCIAGAMLRFRETRPVRWAMATRAGQDVAKLKPGQIFTYSVDSGTGSFFDADQLPNLGRVFAGRPVGPRAKSIADPLAGKWGEWVVDEATGGNVITFRSGYGDGGYASYWGLDTKGEPVCLVTDFRVLVAAQRISFIVPGAFLRPPGEVRHRALDLADLILELAPGTRRRPSLVVGFFGPRAHAAGASLLTSSGEAVELASCGINMSWESEAEYQYDEKVLSRKRPAEDLADLCLRVSLHLGAYPMPTVSPNQ